MSKRTVCDQLPPIGYYGGLNGVLLYQIEYGVEDYIYCKSGILGGGVRYHRVKVYSDTETPYIRLYGRRVRLNECIRSEV